MQNSGIAGVGAILAAALAVTPTLAQSPAAPEPPALVQAYVSQLISRCAGAGAAPSPASVSQAIDLDGDGLMDWLVDGNRAECSARAEAAAHGSQMTIFRGLPEGYAAPVFQRTGFGLQVRRPQSQHLQVWVSLGGADCDPENMRARCERRLTWSPSGRFDLAPITRRPPTSPAANLPPGSPQ
jgi:hypothetical protein